MKILGWILGLPVLISYHILNTLSGNLFAHILFSRDPMLVSKVYEMICWLCNGMIPAFEMVCNRLRGM